MRASLTLAVLLVASLSGAVQAQALYYHHRSTVYGDYLSGAADLVRADGLATRDRAEAYATFIRAESDREDLRQKRLQAFYYEQEHKDQLIRDKAAQRRSDQAAALESLNSDASNLVRQFQMGVFSWPSALQRPEFANSTRLISSLLANWAPEMGDSFKAYRTAMLTEAGILRARVSDSNDVTFVEKVAAVRMLKTLQHLAGLESATLGDSSGQLAAR